MGKTGRGIGKSQRRKDKSQVLRARISQKGFGGRGVEVEHPHAGAEQYRAQVGQVRLVCIQRDQHEKSRGGGGKSDRQTIHAVHQVEGVGHPDQPEERDRDIEEGVREHPDVHALPDQDADRETLPQ